MTPAVAEPVAEVAGQRGGDDVVQAAARRVIAKRQTSMSLSSPARAMRRLDRGARLARQRRSDPARPRHAARPAAAQRRDAVGGERQPRRGRIAGEQRTIGVVGADQPLRRDR